MDEGIKASKMMTILLLSVAVASVVNAAPLDHQSSSSSSAAAAVKRKLSVRSTNKKTVDIDLIRRLVQQKIANDHGSSRRATSVRDPSSFEDDDPLHLMLGSATAPKGRRSENSKRNLNEIKRTNAVNEGHRVQSRFMEAIGLSPYPMGSSDSYNHYSNDQYSSYGSSRYDDDDDDDNYDYDDDDDEYYYDDEDDKN